MRKVNVTVRSKLNKACSDYISELQEANPGFAAFTHEETARFLETQSENFVMLENSSSRQKNAVSFVTGLNNEYSVPASERAFRKQTALIFAKNFWKMALRDSFVNAKYPMGNRTLSTFINLADTPEARYENDRFYRVMTEGTAEQKKEEIARRIEAIGSVDFSGLDLTDDRAFAENYETYYQYKSMTDTQNIVEAAEKYGVDLTEPRFAKYCEKAQTLGSMWNPIGVKERLLEDPLYYRVYADKITPEHQTEIEEEELECPTLDAAVMNHNNLFNEAVDPCMQIFVDPSLTPAERWNKALEINNRQSELYSASVTAIAAERERAAMMTDAEREVYSAPYVPLEDTPDNYFKRYFDRVRSNTHDAGSGNLTEEGAHQNYLATGGKKLAEAVAAYRMQKEYNDLLAEGKAPTGEEFSRIYSPLRFETEYLTVLQTEGFTGVAANLTQDEFERIACGDKAIIKEIDDRARAAERESVRTRNADKHAYYREKILHNVEMIRREAPDFEITDEQIEAMITPERIAMHENAKNVLKGVETKGNKASYMAYGKFDLVFQRVVQFMGKREGTPGADEYNAELYKKITDPSERGNEFRKRCVVELMNRANTLSPDGFRGKTEKERFDYAIENYENGCLAFDIGNMTGSLRNVGMAMEEGAAAQVNAQTVYLSDLGTLTTDTVKQFGNEDLFTMPLDLINFDLAARLLKIPDPKFSAVAGMTFNIVNDRDNARNLLAKPSESGKTYSEDCLHSTRPADERGINDCSDVRNVFAKYRRELVNADHFYNFRNSDEYTKLLSSLEKADKVLGAIGDGYVPLNMRQQLRDVIGDVYEKAVDYKTKKSAQDQNDVRRARIAASTQLSDYAKRLISVGTEKTVAGSFASDPVYCTFLNGLAGTQEIRNEEITREVFAEKDLPVDEATAEREAVFNAGLHKTQAERDKIFAMKHGTAGRKAQIMAVKARDGLTDLVGRKTIDQNKARLLMATLVCCEGIVNSSKAGADLSHDDIRGLIRKVAEDKAFARVTRDITSDKINALLTEGASERLAAEYKAASRSNAAPAADKAREAGEEAVLGG